MNNSNKMRTVVRKNKMMSANDLMSSVLNDFLGGEFVSGRREVKWKPAVNVFKTQAKLLGGCAAAAVGPSDGF